MGARRGATTTRVHAASHDFELARKLSLDGIGHLQEN